MDRLVRALLLSAVVGAAILGALRFLILPEVARRASRGDLAWMRDGMHAHPVASLVGVFLVAAVLSLPVLLVGLWAAQLGPWRRRAPRL